MNDKAPDLNDLYYFVQVVDHGGFAAAGRALGEPKSKLSRRIARLEARLDVSLIHRSTRRFSVTDIGQAYYTHCKAMLVEANAAQEAIDLSRAEPCGTVRITCPITLSGFHVSQILADFMVQYPRVDVHLEATDRRVDLFDEAIDIALRVRPLPLEDSELVVRRLGISQQVLLASPQLTSNAQPTVPADLTLLPSLGHGQPHQEFQWQLHHSNGANATIRHHPRLITRDMSTLRSAAVAGVGIVQLPTMVVAEEVSRGQLQALLPEWMPRSEMIHLAYTSRRGMLPSVRTLIDYLSARFAADGDTIAGNQY